MKFFNRLLRTHNRRIVAWVVTLVVLGASVAGEVISSRREAELDPAGIVAHLNEIRNLERETTSQWLEETDTTLLEKLWNATPQYVDPLHEASIYLLQNDTIKFWQGDELRQDVTHHLLVDQPTIVEMEGRQLIILGRRNNHGRIASMMLPLLDSAVAQHYDFPEEYVIKFYPDPNIKPTAEALPEGAVRVEYSGVSFYVSVVKVRPHVHLCDITGWAALLMLVSLVSYSLVRRTRINNALWMWLLAMGLLLGIRVGILFVPLNIFSGDALPHYFTGYKEYLFSPFNLLVSAIITLILGYHKYSIRRKLSLHAAALSPVKHLSVVMITITIRAAMLIYFHWALIENIYNPSINVDLFRLFSTTPGGMLIYISIGIYMVARLFQTEFNQQGVSDREHWMQIGFGFVVLAMMLIPLADQLHGTWPLLVIYSTLFRSLVVLSRRFKPSTLYTVSVVITAMYFTMLVMSESRVARYEMARDYLEVIDQNQTDPTFQEPAQYRLYSYAIINKFKLRLKSNNQAQLQDLLSIADRDTLIREGTYTHIITPQANQTIIISYPDIRMMDWVAMFSYQFVIFYLLGGIILKMLGLRDVNSNLSMRSLRFKLQAMIMSIVVVIMVMVTMLSMNYSVKSAGFTQRQIINNKIRIMLTNLNLYQADHPMEENFLTLWYNHIGRSLGYDVAMYDTQGILITAHPDSPTATRYRMDNVAVAALKYRAEPFFTLRDGESTLTVIIPAYYGTTLLGFLDTRFVDPLGKTLTYPVMEDIFNLFVVIFVASMVFSLGLNRVVTKPLENLRLAMSNVGLMRKIEVRSPETMDSEIKQLVVQYNKMIDYLEQSYADLARSERESAWQEMARRVAHEIKNPLTPMKLKVQMLQRARREGQQCADIKLDETLTLLNEQIDIITRIVEEFRDFARMREAAPSIINICTLVRDVTALYDSYEQVSITFENACSEPVWVYADSSQLNRVIGNICKNAAEALAEARTTEPTINVALTRVNSKAQIKIMDNGPGISPEIAPHIFEPNFTTKAGGSGLGLVISQQIIKNLGGQLSFVSNGEGKPEGTTFVIDLPVSYAPPKTGKPDDK